MIDSEMVRDICTDFAHDCRVRGREPTKTALARALAVSRSTVHRVVCGCYDSGREYSKKEHYNRRICNADFDTVRGVWVKN